MRISRVLPASAVAMVMAMSLGAVSLHGQSSKDDSTTAPQESVKPANTTQLTTTNTSFAALARVKAEPMTAQQLNSVKGMHIHFATGSANPGHPHEEPTLGWHFVNHQENNLGNGQAPAGAGPGYSGLCGAALKSPKLFIPGQDPMTGSGGGC